jgi:hypothetical protein
MRAPLSGKLSGRAVFRRGFAAEAVVGSHCRFIY